ncbi:regulator of G-protein signaling [Acrasis kona]|uniref:Regulator of G-protein signaling n=1 Tax=Acrasis kona TaxID=1008807 RepID=A0AAW2YJ81_9EUKA
MQTQQPKTQTPSSKKKTSDHSSSNTNKPVARKKNFLLQNVFSFYNIGIVISSIIIFLIGTAIGVPLFFVFQGQDKESGREQLKASLLYQVEGIYNSLVPMYKLSGSLSEFYKELNGSVGINYVNDFKPFVERTDLFVHGLVSTAISIIVNDTTQLQQRMRSKGGFYTNFTAEVKQPLGTTVAIIIAAAPAKFSFIIGKDTTYEPSLKDVYLKVAATKKNACGPRRPFLAQDGEKGGGYSILYYQPILDGSNLLGVSSTGLNLNAFFTNALLPGTASRIVQQVFDVTNGTSEFLYSSATDEQVPFGVPASQMTELQHVSMQRMYEYSEYQDVNVADRTWRVFYIPTTDYLGSFNSGTKWMAIIIYLVVCVVFTIMVIFMMKVWEYYNNQSKLDKERMLTAQKYQDNIQAMMNRISDADARIATVINAIPDFVIVINNSGCIVMANASFSRQFGTTSNDYDKHLNISMFFPDLEESFYVKLSESTSINTSAKTRFNSIVPVQVIVRTLDSSDDLEEEAYVIVARNLSDREKLLDNIENQKRHLSNMLKHAEFDAHFHKDEKFRKAFLAFCKNNRTEENGLFLEEVRRYKKSAVEKRAEKQFYIFSNFIKIGSPHQLNISSELSTHMESRLNKSLGDSDLFNNIEELIKSEIVVDLYPRFLNQEKKKSYVSEPLI